MRGQRFTRTLDGKLNRANPSSQAGRHSPRAARLLKRVPESGRPSPRGGPFLLGVLARAEPGYRLRPTPKEIKMNDSPKNTDDAKGRVKEAAGERHR